MSIIKNRDELLSHGNVEGRKIVLDVLEYALEAIGSSEMVRKLVSLETNILKVGTLTFDLSKIGDIYVVGAGKGVSSIAETLEDILGDKIKKGLVIEKKGQGRRLRFIDVIEAGHPVPDEEGVRASRMILEIVNSTKESDVV
ncbi:MAG: DUF4147 domain-containing protein, partial [Candidatus Bathyarchaeia archaeon]